MVYPKNTSEALILRPDCSFEIVSPTLDANGTITTLNCTDTDIEELESFPPVTNLYVDSNPLFDGDFSKGETLSSIVISWNDLVSIKDFVFPPTLSELDVAGNSIFGIAEDELPSNLKKLILDSNKLSSLNNFTFPDSLELLYLYENNFATLNMTIPPNLIELYMDGNPLIKFGNIDFPDSLEVFSCISCGVESVSGVKFSASLKELNLDSNRVTSFEIRESDEKVIKNLATILGSYASSSCDSDVLREVQIEDGPLLCVISDELFEQKYRSPVNETSQSGDGANTAVETPAPTVEASSSSGNSTVVIVVSVIGGLIFLVVLYIAYRVYQNKKNRPTEFAGKFGSRGHYENASTIQMFGTNDTMLYNSQEYLSNDVRNDEELIPFRIAQDEIQVVKQISKGGFGVIHYATFRGREVAVKQLLPEKAKNKNSIKSFMDEIRMCAKLDHPKVVQFVGIAWTTLVDIAVVIEYMARGDLATILQAQQKPDLRYWYEPSSMLKSKTLVALDTIEALVYLHSFETPVIHRDLKARNVLISADGDAKLSDFGISRELSIDETMTGEIGTVAWIAPEVLQGERYSEKADIYSFGALLVELDTGRHPYSKDIETEETSRLSTSHTNTRIAMMVSAGVLKPVPSRSCPRRVKDLIARCTSYNPSERPTGIEIHFELRKVLESRTMSM
ncbi:hypothetical protein Poli38472_013841 [Pythium oligandrum]|uniref:Protein kinase domain-containing protein n=1 Tax=Pythium oligandrum TaxID=41045 RepID=A0A8K1FBQ8_PYTOL|nr:hypothetical protein Poli38472_013841 [Pythium oligandrum]|eukprot:TMW55079.1 hypothetical protein Poli38472_013841 [Pythium oligandrum]